MGGAREFLSAGIPVGRYLAVDGSLVPAWAQQRGARVHGKWDRAREDHLRRRTPEAGFVAYSVRGRYSGRLGLLEEAATLGAKLQRIQPALYHATTLALPSREVFARGQRAIVVVGPLLEDEAAAPHLGFWR